MLLERLHAAAAAQGRIGSVIEIGMLQALALAASGDDAAAVAALAEALTLGHPENYIRVFADEGAPMRPCWASLSPPSGRNTRRPAPSHSATWLGCCTPSATAHRAGLRAGHRAARSGRAADHREVEVLGLLGAGKSNPSIAAELVVTVDTVKKHVSHVLDKLGATNRTEAVTRARS